ncbi:MAG: DUF3783 domain-containing protein [Ruminococcus sp.]|nr:DUF3783 domain-containing protein [Ruminococcus sp.]
MKARISEKTPKKLLGFCLSETHTTQIGAAAAAYGAETVFTRDLDTPISKLLDGADGKDGENIGASADECLVIAGFGRDELNELLDSLRETGVRIPLKAIYTPHNSAWSFKELIAELKKEHEYMTRGGRR